MAQMGLKLLNMTEEEKREYLVVFVENDKCPADGIQVATGCSAEAESLKCCIMASQPPLLLMPEQGRGIG